jgi:methyl-accepting chemotaxis protein
MTAYFPIADATGKVVGILYVGIPMAQFEAMLTQAIESMAVAAGIAALLVLVLTLFVVRRVTRPLTSVTHSLTALANGQSDVAIDCDDRADEIGEIARTVAVFKSNSLERARMRSEQAEAAAAAVEQRNCAISSVSSAAASAAFSTRCCIPPASSSVWPGN